MGEVLKRNWKTSVCGVLSLVAVIVYWLGYIDREQLEVGVSVLASAGFILARDGS